MRENYDLIIVGAGPIGLACAIEAERKGLNYLVLEKGALTNSLFNYPLYMTFFTTSERLEIGDIPFNCAAAKPGRQEALEYYRNIHRFYDFKLNLYEEVYSIVKKTEEEFEVLTSKTLYQSKKVIIATGFYDFPVLLNIPGEDLPKTSHYYKEAHPYAYQRVVVIGANNSAVDAALECFRKGAEVTMIIRGEDFTDGLKYWIRPDIENRIKEGEIKAYFNANVTSIREDYVNITTAEGELELENDFVLAMTGYMPNIPFLEKVGIEFSTDGLSTPYYNSETMETNVKGLYLAGVVCGGMQTRKWFIENSRIHAGIILNHIKG